MRCDLHVHTVHSALQRTGVNRICLESFNEPLALCERLKQRGMDLITVTDHDSIDAVEELRRVNGWCARWVRWWMLLAARAGDGWLWGAVSIALLCSSDGKRFRPCEAAGAAVAAGMPFSTASSGGFAARALATSSPTAGLPSRQRQILFSLRPVHYGVAVALSLV